MCAGVAARDFGVIAQRFETAGVRAIFLRGLQSPSPESLRLCPRGDEETLRASSTGMTDRCRLSGTLSQLLSFAFMLIRRKDASTLNLLGNRSVKSISRSISSELNDVVTGGLRVDCGCDGLERARILRGNDCSSFAMAGL